jgi:uncharacterized repeat protein (TIGR04076 family)
MDNCKITVLKKDFYQEMVDLCPVETRKRILGPCQVFNVGQEITVSPFTELPQGFCPWAWDDIFKTIALLMEDNTPGACSIACCTDGTRPVTFKIEKIEA